MWSSQWKASKVNNLPDNMQAIAPAKINLFLHVTGARDDGYHTLNSIVTFTTDGDDITISAGTETQDSLEILGEFAKECPNNDDNFIFKAIQLMRAQFNQEHQPPIHVTLTKNLPIASGIGGGSSDAATIMNMLNEYWSINASFEELTKAGLTLGADVPMCLYGKRCFISGIGEDITPVAVEGDSYDIVLLNALREVSTPSVFNAYDRLQVPKKPSAIVATKTKYVSYYNHDASAQAEKISKKKNEEISNHLTAAAISICPVIQDVLDLAENAQGVKLCSMSGSGGTIFAVMTSTEDAAALTLSARKKGWWAMQTSLRL